MLSYPGQESFFHFVEVCKISLQNLWITETRCTEVTYVRNSSQLHPICSHVHFRKLKYAGFCPQKVFSRNLSNFGRSFNSKIWRLRYKNNITQTEHEIQLCTLNCKNHLIISSEHNRSIITELVKICNLIHK